jgi:8-oxo-dGTP diphosphatase
MRHSHCTYCGTAYPAGIGWPRLCAGCGETTWHNPLPVAVTLLPVFDDAEKLGLVVVRRGIEPGYGELGLPGGFIEVGETWQEAAARELFEETGITADPGTVELFAVHSSPTTHTLQVFGTVPPRPVADLPDMAASEEVLEWLVLTAPQELAFSTHTVVMADYFASA